MSIWKIPANVELLREWWPNPDISVNEMARRLGVTKHAVKGKSDRLGLPFRRYRGHKEPEVSRQFKTVPVVKSNVREVRHSNVHEMRQSARITHIAPCGRCQWIYGDDRKTWRQCETMADKDSPYPRSYCEEHRKLAYVKVAKWYESA